jgi:sulfur carrier protein ThiS
MTQTGSRGTYVGLLAKVGVPAGELVVDVGGEVLEAGDGQRRELLPGLVPLRVEVVADGQERHWRKRVSGVEHEDGAGRTGVAVLGRLAAHELVVDVRAELLELLPGEAR